MIQYPITFSEAVPAKYFISLNDELISNWQLNNYSYSPQERVSWGMDKYLRVNLSFLSVGAYLKLKIKKVLKRELKLCKIQVNGQTAGQTSEFHKDFFHDGTWTFVLFCGYEWNTSWGGEFVCYDEINNKYHYATFIPNTGVLIPSNWDHYGSSPNISTDKLRTTVAFSYCDPSVYDKVILDNPYLTMF